VGLAVLVATEVACGTGRYSPLGEAGPQEIVQLEAHVFRVEYRVSPFTSQDRLDAYVRRRSAELTIREGYDFFHLSQRADTLMLTRQTAITVTMYKDGTILGAYELYDARAVLRESPADGAP
jgi:hypothetical protein